MIGGGGGNNANIDSIIAIIGDSDINLGDPIKER